MFIAQVDETDIYDKNGQQEEDINSLVEYLADVCNFEHQPLKDSDDDNARYFHLENLNYSFFNENFIELKKPFAKTNEKVKYPPHLQQKISSIFLEIQLPPPKA
jgi:hypothetical protein